MDLTGEQNELIAAVAKANPKTIVVLNVGSPVAMPWANDVAAIVLAYYPGMDGAISLTNILCGEVNPSGKLTVTYPHALKDTPAFNNYPGKRDVVYGEGIFVGYRHYDYRESRAAVPVRAWPVLHDVRVQRMDDARSGEARRDGEGVREGEEHRHGGGQGSGAVVRARQAGRRCSVRRKS